MAYCTANVRQSGHHNGLLTHIKPFPIARGQTFSIIFAAEGKRQ